MNKRRTAKNRAQNGQVDYRSLVKNFTLTHVGRMVGVKSVMSLHDSRKIQDRLDRREAAFIEDLRVVELYIETITKDDQRHTIGERNAITNFEDMSDACFPQEELNLPGYSNEDVAVNDADDSYQDRYEDDDVEEASYDDGDQYLGEYDNYEDYQYDGANYDDDGFKYGHVQQYRDANDDVEDHAYAAAHQNLVANTNDNEDRKFGDFLDHRNGEISDEVNGKKPRAWVPSKDCTPHVILPDQWANNYDWTEYMRRSIARESEVKEKLNKADEKLMNDDSPDVRNELVDLHISDKHPYNRIIINLGKHLEKQPIFKAILSSDIDAFFNEVVSSDYIKNKECESCFCTQNNPDIRFQSKKDLLHIAAAVSTVEFVKTMVDPKLYSQAIKKCGRDIPNIESIEEHYKKNVDRWLVESNYCMMSATCLAAEFNRLDMVSMLLTHHIDAAGEKKRTYPLLDTLVQSRFLNRIDPPELVEYIFNSASNKHLDHAIRKAVEVGDHEVMLKAVEKAASHRIEQIGELRKEEADERKEKSFIPGVFSSAMQKLRVAPERNSSESHEFPSYAQILAENELMEQFERMHVTEKTEMSAYGWTSLVALLNFPDEFVERHLRSFHSVKREDLFLFISQVIIKNRLNLLTAALQMTFSNPINFEKIETDVYEAYGLPEYIALPMETALSRTGDMRIVEHIAGFYLKQDNFTRSIIREDALRCIRSIQDNASKISDHIRLAVIMMMRTFVDMTTYEFREALRMYPQQNIDDPVEAYVMQHFVQWAYRQDRNPSLITWKDAFEQAGAEVGKWSPIETELPMNILKKKRNTNIQVSKSIWVNPERAEQKKREKMANEKEEKSKTLSGTSAALCKIDQLTNIDY